MVSTDRSIRHRIKKAIFDLQFPNESTAFSARKRLEEFFYQIVVPTLEEAFERYAPNGSVYRINHLEIDLGRINAEHLDPRLIRQIILTQLSRQLPELFATEVETTPDEVALEETLAGFLELGQWPWHMLFDQVEELEVALQALTPAQARSLVSRLLPLLQRPGIRLRVIYQFSSWFFEWLIEQLHPGMSERILQIGRTVLGELESSAARERLLTVVVALPQGEPTLHAMLEAQMRQAVESQGSPAPDLPGRGPNPAPAALRDESLPEAQQEYQAETELYVRHAGIVLLHPFLERFFARLGLLDDRKQFTSTVSRTKAVHLLYYLATAQENPEEHELLLFKLLCDFPMQSPLVKELPLHQSERAEAESLLLAIIQHWTRLGNTSPAGLREAFLERDGRLAKRESGWTLDIEQRTVDVLLAYLPWGIGLVALPWRVAPLWVNWA